MDEKATIPKWKYTKDSVTVEAVKRRNSARRDKNPDGKIQFTGARDESNHIYSQIQ